MPYARSITLIGTKIQLLSNHFRRGWRNCPFGRVIDLSDKVFDRCF